MTLVAEVLVVLLFILAGAFVAGPPGALLGFLAASAILLPLPLGLYAGLAFGALLGWGLERAYSRRLKFAAVTAARSRANEGGNR
jgi:hypothetical protein